MKTILWLAILFFGLPILVTLSTCIYNLNSADSGMHKKSKIYIFEIVGLALLIWSIIEVVYFSHHSNANHSFPLFAFFTMFPSVKAFTLFIMKFVLGITYNILTLIAVKGLKNRKKWSLRIEKALSGPLGEQLKNRLPNDSLYYYVGAHFEDSVVSFYIGDTLERITFRSLGYENFPDHYSDIICKWIQEHIVLEKEMYHLEKVEKTISSWSGGSPDYVETKRTSTGFESRYVSGDLGREEKDDVIIGYRLKHSNYISPKQKQKLKTW